MQRGEDRVRIRRAPNAQEFAVSAPTPAAVSALPGVPAAGLRESVEKAPDPNVVLVKSPIVGTYYDCSSPGSPPFVRSVSTCSPARSSASSNR